MTGKKCKIMIVDDSNAVRKAVGLMLQGGDYECVEAEDGAEALAMLGKHEVDCVISDLHMPKVNGLELLQKMREMPKYKFTPVLILTTDRVDENRAELRRAGATGILSKPIDQSELVGALDRAVAAGAAGS